MPASRIPSSKQMRVSVRRAFFTFGFAKMGTALLTASTPVIAVQPLANARMSNHALTGIAVAASGGGAATGVGWPLVARLFQTPMAITNSNVQTNKYVGRA